MKPAFIILLGAAVVLGGFVAFRAWEERAIEGRAGAAVAQAEQFLDLGQPLLARNALARARVPAAGSPLAPKWAEVEMRIAVAARDFEKLEALKASAPEAFLRDSQAPSLLARQQLSAGNEVEAPPGGQGVLFGADRAILSGNASAARQILESAPMEGAEEADRLSRLALLDAGNRTAAWESLSKAYAAAPDKMEVRTFSANLLEEAGNNDLAQREYVGALVSDPSNPRARDNLAGFYIRQGLPALAVTTWAEAPPAAESGPLYLKAWFWNRVGFGAADLAGLAAQSALIARLDALAPGEFWDSSLDSVLKEAPAIAGREEIFWLRLLESLKGGRDFAAAKLMASGPPPKETSHPLLLETLGYLIDRRMDMQGSRTYKVPASQAEGHPFWAWLAGNPSKEELSAPWVLPTLLAVSGWPRAATDLATDVAGAPPWALYALAQSARACGEGEAVRRLTGGASAPELRLLAAEQAWAEGKEDEGRTALEQLATDPLAGSRAGLLLAIYYLEKGDAPSAKALLQGESPFAKTLPGKEFLARAHLLAGDEPAALAIYEDTWKDSDDAKIFLSKRAFLSGDLGRAESLTRALADAHPNEPAFAANLEKIQAARKALPPE